MSNKQKIAKPIEISKFSSRVDIIIPFHGQYEQVTRLIESILRSTYSNVYQLILVDDGSMNKNYISDLIKVPNVECVRQDEQKGFGNAMFTGFKRSEEMNKERMDKNKPTHPYLVFMQSDCVVESVNWLKALGETMLDLKSDSVKMVGTKTNNPMVGDERQKSDKSSDGENIILDKSNLAMHCFMVHRDLFRHVGGFIKEYPYGAYEDEEFAYRLRKYGFKQAISGKSWVRHTGGSTIKRLWKHNSNIRNIMENDNRNRCIEDMKKLALLKLDINMISQ